MNFFLSGGGLTPIFAIGIDLKLSWLLITRSDFRSDFELACSADLFYLKDCGK